MNYSLDIEETKQIPFDKYIKDFSFIINGKEFKTNRFLADLLSPIIRNAHYQDSSYNTFSFTIEDIDIDKEELKEQPLETYFDEFLQLCNFTNINLDDTHQKYFSAYFYALGNLKEYFRIRAKYFEGVTVQNVINKIIIISSIKAKFLTNNQFDGYFKLIEFASENFEDIDKKEMKKLNLEDIDEILKSDKLKLNNEDSLMKFIINLYEQDRSNSSLFEYIIFNNLSKRMIDAFISIFDIENLDTRTWTSICRRLSQAAAADESCSKRYRDKSIKFELDPNDKFNGILKYLTNKTGGNIVDNGTVAVTSNSANCPVRNLIRFDSTDYFQYIDKAMANVVFDFKDRSVKIDKYAIHTGTWGTNNGHLKSWVIEASNNGEKWDEIDNRSNNSSLNGQKYSSTFEAQNKRNQFYRYVRLRQTGHAWSPESENRFEIMYIEFYGFLKELSNK